MWHRYCIGSLRNVTMLDSWIIDEILRRERRRPIERPVLEAPMCPPEVEEVGEEERRDEPERGVVVVDFSV